VFYTARSSQVSCSGRLHLEAHREIPYYHHKGGIKAGCRRRGVEKKFPFKVIYVVVVEGGKLSRRRTRRRKR
jgi:hypothetical protein